MTSFGINAINPFELSLLNTVILLSSGVTVTYAHHSLIQGNRSGVIYGLIATIILAIIFTALQGIEYTVSSFTISDSVFGSCFYFGTGFSGAPIKLKIKKYRYNYTTLKKGISPFWVTGFSDAESSFVIKIGKDTTRKFFLCIKPKFSIELNKRDLALLKKKIQSFFGVGTIRTRIRTGKSTAIYSVQSLKDLTNIVIPHFKQYALLTQKRTDF